MAIQLFKFREFQNGMFLAVVWIDDTKSVDGKPDPSYLRPFIYGPVQQGTTKANYLTGLKQETKRLVQAELANLNDEGTPLAGEGANL